MSDERIEIEITLDSGAVVKGLANVKSAGVDAASSTEKSFNNAQGAVSKFGKSILALGAGFLALKGVQSAIRGINSAIQASSEQQTSINALNSALALTGKFSKDASQSIQSLASQIERSSNFSGEQVLDAASKIQTLGNLSVRDLGRASQAAADFAARLNVDIGTAANLVGRAAAGNTEAFSRYGIEVDKTKTKAEQFSQILTQLESKFGGGAAAAADTFQGSIKQLGNSFDDILKSIGNLFTRSPALIVLFQELTLVFRKFSDSFSQSNSEDFFKSIIINLSVILQATIVTAQRIALSFELAWERAKAAFNAFKVLTTAGLSDSFNAALQANINEIDRIKAAFSETDDSAVISFFDRLIAKVQATSGTLVDLSEKFTNIAPKDVTENIVENVSKVGAQIQQGFGNAISQGIQAAVRALATGQNAFAAFGKAVIGVFGDLAIQLGTFFIVTSSALASLKSLDPTGGIAAGIALVALGTFLKILAGAGSSGPQVNGVGGNAPLTPDLATNPVNQPPERLERETRVAINVEGTVLDPISVGQQIASILNDTFSATGTRVVTG